MAIPEGYEKLAAIGIAYKGTYAGSTSYKFLNAVYYSGSTYVALKDNPVKPPVGDGVNWQYLAQGFVEGVMDAINVTDTSGVLGVVGEEVNAQTFLDVIADRVMTKLIPKDRIVNNLLATDETTVLGGTQGKELDDKITDLNRKLGSELSGNADRGTKFNTSGSVKYYTKNGWCFVSMELTPSSDVAHNDIVCSNLPLPLMPTTFLSLSTASSVGGNYAATFGSNGIIAIYYPGYKTASRIDYSFSYPLAE